MEIYRADGEIIYLLSPVAIKAGSAIFFPWLLLLQFAPLCMCFICLLLLLFLCKFTIKSNYHVFFNIVDLRCLALTVKSYKKTSTITRSMHRLASVMVDYVSPAT